MCPHYFWYEKTGKIGKNTKEEEVENRKQGGEARGMWGEGKEIVEKEDYKRGGGAGRGNQKRVGRNVSIKYF